MKHRRNPAHPGYAQWLFKLGFPSNDPIIELASVWASGTTAGSRLIKQARISAERWMESKDKRMRSAARSVYNRLGMYAQMEEQAEGARQFRYAPHSLTSNARYENPRRKIEIEKVGKAGYLAFVPYGSGLGADYKEIGPFKTRHQAEAVARARLRTGRGLPRGRRNPFREFKVRDRFMGGFHEYGKVSLAMRKAQQMGLSRRDAVQEIYVDKDESIQRLIDAEPRTAQALVGRENPYPNEHSARITDPKKFVQSSFRRKNVKGGSIGLIMGKRIRGRGKRVAHPMVLQAVRFRSAFFTPTQAKAWLRSHKIRVIRFEPATNRGRAAWKGEVERAKRAKSRHRLVHRRSARRRSA